VTIADSLGRLDPEPDLRLADALRDRVAQTMAGLNGDHPEIIVVDHGSPVRPVALLRDQVAARLAEYLGSSVHSVRAASMERPEGDAYAFNDPLLAAALADRPPGPGPVVVCQLFLAPGRHAGPDGDIASICRTAEATTPRTEDHHHRADRTASHRDRYPDRSGPGSHRQPPGGRLIHSRGCLGSLHGFRAQDFPDSPQ
jgi:hypothetical protein